MRKIVYVVRATAVLGDIAAGNGNAVAEPDNLDVEPGSFDHLVVDENFTGVGGTGANDFTIFVDEAGFGHEGPNFGENLAVEAFTGYTEPTFSVRVDIAEGEVYDCPGGVGNTVEDIEVIESA